MKKEFLMFLETKNISEDDYKGKSDSEKSELHSEFFNEQFKQLKKDIESKPDAKKLSDAEKELKSLKEGMKDYVKSDDFEKMQKQLTEAQETIDQLKEDGGNGSRKGKSIKQLIDGKKESIKKMVSNKSGNVEIEVKASHNATDIADRDVYAEIESGTNRKPFRRFNIAALFRRLPITKEYLKYREENTVTRDGKVVVRCATSTHNTKKSWVVRTLEIAKVRDLTDICEDMMDDYDFVEGEIKELVEQSVNAKEEQELLSGTGDGTNGTYLSINTISSEFSAANALASFDKAFQAPTLAELTAAMKSQIETFGQENAWKPNVIAMNSTDLVKFKHQKNANNDYLLPHFISTNGNVLSDMQIVTSPLIAPNTLYVFDSNQGVIRDRKSTTVSMYFENKDNAEHEMVTVKALKRSQLHVKHINRDAFMKCSDIGAALTAITKA
ncbi:phage major capsid protein [Tenacibaculum maritimum]|uniref:phage major capsid protein n=1 Tax=Tenacibaculum maritimum TaxID=107401 RepID=UPI0038908D00